MTDFGLPISPDPQLGAADIRRLFDQLSSHLRDAGTAGLGASFGLDLSTKSHWARPATVLTMITAAAALVVLAVRLGVLINDAGGYDSNNDNHNATRLGIIAVPLAVVTAIVAL